MFLCNQLISFCGGRSTGDDRRSSERDAEGSPTAMPMH